MDLTSGNGKESGYMLSSLNGLPEVVELLLSTYLVGLIDILQYRELFVGI